MAVRAKVRVPPRLESFSVGTFTFCYWFELQKRDGSDGYTQWYLPQDYTHSTSNVMDLVYEIKYNADTGDVSFEPQYGFMMEEYPTLFYCSQYAFTDNEIPAQTFSYPDTDVIQVKASGNLSNVHEPFEREFHNNRAFDDDYLYYGIYTYGLPHGLNRSFTITASYNVVVNVVDHLYINSDSRTVRNVITLPATITMNYNASSDYWTINTTGMGGASDQPVANFRNKENVGVILTIDMSSVSASIAISD